MRKIEPSAFRRMPWKNGGGETAEIAVAPFGATADTFDWRVSTARVAKPGPFSHFPGIDRSLTVLSGDGLRLVTGPSGSGENVLLNPASAPFRFAGDVPAYAELINGKPVVDFNVMSRRSDFNHLLSKVSTHDVTEVEGNAVVLYCLSGNAECFAKGTSLFLSAGDALAVGDARSERLTTLTIEVRGADILELLVAQFFRRGQGHE